MRWRIFTKDKYKNYKGKLSIVNQKYHINKVFNKNKMYILSLIVHLVNDISKLI